VNRRTFLGTLSGGLLAPPLAAGAQEYKARKVYRIGVLHGIQAAFDPNVNVSDKALVEGLRALGWDIGRNVIIEFRSAASRPERLPQLAAELVAIKVDVIVTILTAATLAARQATRTIPIVMIGAADPVATGLITSLAHPGGNLTGLAVNFAELSAKRVQLLQEAVPKLSRVAVLWNSTFKSMALGFQEIEIAAPKLGVTIQSLRAEGPQDFDAAFAAMRRERPGGLVVLFGPITDKDLPRLVEFTIQNRLPAVFEGQVRQAVFAGALMAYGTKLSALVRDAGVYIDKILRGAKPGDLPVEEPSTFDLVINLKTAKALGLTIPPSLLQRADQVIE
jgi:ABC-type uncharacterized transport system substrate-binding protein